MRYVGTRSEGKPGATNGCSPLALRESQTWGDAGNLARLGFETRKEQAMATLKQDTAHEQRVMNRTIFAKAGAVAYVI
jgi:hypothetical protein